MDPSPSEDDFVEPANLRFLRRLVTVLTAVMIGGLLLLVGLFVIRFQTPPDLPLPEEIVLPEGATLVSVTYTPDLLLVVTDAQTLLVFDALTGDLRKTLDLN